MFEAIAVSSRMNPRGDISTMSLAESLLYYGKVHLVGGGGLIAQLSRSPGTLQTLELIERGHLCVQYERQMLGIQTGGVDNQFHSIAKFGPVDVEPKEMIARALRHIGWENSQSKVMASRFAKKISEFEYPNYDGKWSTQALLDREFVRAVLPKYFAQFGALSTLSNDFNFEVYAEAELLRVESNINYAAATLAFQRAFGKDAGNVTPALLLDALRRTADQQFIGATLNAEIQADEMVLAGGAARLSAAVQRSTNSLERIQQFEAFVFEGVGGVEQALTSGKRTFDEFLTVLQSAQRFREWIAKQPPSADLLNVYHKSIAEKTFLEKLRGKTFRYSVFTGGGIVADALLGGGGLGTLAGAALSAGDTFLLERLGLGWKPHHFVTGDLRDFVMSER